MLRRSHRRSFSRQRTPVQSGLIANRWNRVLLSVYLESSERFNNNVLQLFDTSVGDTDFAL